MGEAAEGMFVSGNDDLVPYQETPSSIVKKKYKARYQMSSLIY